MLWMKAWLETRWKLVWMLVMGVIFFGVIAATIRSAHSLDRQHLLLTSLAMISLLLFISAIMFAGSGIQTGSTRPGEVHKGIEGSMIFTLSLPVTRARLFLVRTAAGALETLAFTTLVAAAGWLLVPVSLSAHDVLGYWALIAGCGLTFYAISACLSTFCDEGWRIRCSGLAVVLLFALSMASAVPRSINIFVLLISSSPLITHQTPWDAITAACALATLFLVAGLAIIRSRDYS